MKLSKKLMTLLGVSALGLGALVPTVGANAASGKDPTTGSDTTVLPAATTGGTNDQSGSASAQTNAHVEISGGYLILNQVPDFNFGTVKRGAKNNALVDNTNPDKIASDGNDTGTLQVSDYRDDGNGGAALGYSVTANIGNFVNHANGVDMNGNAIMYLKATTGTTAEDDTGTDATDTTSTAATLNAGTAATVLNFTNGSGYGVTTINFNTEGTASLDVPSTVANGSYNAPITWTLNAAAPTN